MNFALTGNTKDEIVQVLMERFSLGKTSVYNKFKLLEISITKQGKIFGLSQEDLDNFQAHIPQLRAEKKIVHLYYFFLRRFIVDFNNFIKNPV